MINLKNILILFFLMDKFCPILRGIIELIILYFLHFFAFSSTNLLFGDKVGEYGNLFEFAGLV